MDADPRDGKNLQRELEELQRHYKPVTGPPEPFELVVRPRSYWGAREPNYKVPLEIPIAFMCITYRQPLSDEQDEKKVLQEMQNFDMDRLGMPDIESNFLIGKEGVVYEGRGWFSSPSLGDKCTPKMKENIGKYFQVTYFADYETDPQNNPLLKAAALLLEDGLKKNVVSHSMQFMEVISREEWGARPTISTRKFKDLPLRFAVLSLTTRTKECRSLEECCRMMRRIQHMDMAKRGLKDIRYNFYLGSDGNAYEGRGWKVLPPNNNKYHGRQGQYIHIVCIGDFRKEPRPVPMYKAQWDLLTLATEKEILRKDFRFF